MSTISSQNALSSVEAAHTDATENARYSAPSSSRAKFDAAQLQPQLTSTLNLRLRHATWDKSDKERNRALSRSIAELVKAKMLGFKYIVQVQLVENLGQGGRCTATRWCKRCTPT
ncbi:related to Tctex2-related inner arm dynein light chain [Moesziomyces antarcticus]|uniref:Related to Tctex2-related inner arm dynein light chain n=1 Tax=Pseudozyma antarctica TaxID=84753 RepID=A0A5C3FZ55_PSEA2|nr:related to Tctex2-related inner arm dynein light chain [Moesziomyces antarcticus]